MADPRVGNRHPLSTPFGGYRTSDGHVIIAVLGAASLAVGLALLVVWLFLRDWRATWVSALALPLSITVIFGFMNEVAADGTITRVANPNAPSALTYAWIGPFIGALIRPLGGWISDKVGGSIVTQVISVVMVIASVAAGYVMHQAYGSAQPEEYFFLFLVLFLVLFAASGIGNGSTFRTIGVIYDREKAGPVLGWTSAVAAYGSFVAPIVIGEQVKAGTPEVAMYGFAVFYALCLILNWWFYLRPNAYVKNP